MHKEKYDPKPFQELLRRLIGESGEPPSRLMRAAGLHREYLQRWLSDDRPSRPGRGSCIALAEYLDLNPNVFLRAAGYKPMAVFDFAWAVTENMSAPAVRVAAKLSRVEDQALQARLAEAIETLIEGYLVAGE